MQQFLAFRKPISRHRFLSDNIGTAYCAQHATIPEDLHTEPVILNGLDFQFSHFPTPNFGVFNQCEEMGICAESPIRILLDDNRLRRLGKLQIHLYLFLIHLNEFL